MTAIDRSRLRSAAGRALTRYPGPVGEILARELRSWEEMNFRYGGHGLMERLVTELLVPTTST